jgi:hypothetical protein
LTLLGISHVQFDFIGISFELRSIQRGNSRGQSAESARGFGSKPVAQTVVSSRQSLHEKVDPIITKFGVGSHAVLSVATADIDGFESSRFEILEMQVLVIIFTVNRELNFYKISTNECGKILEFGSLELFYFLM